MNDTLLDPVPSERPASEIDRHGDHFDATRWRTNDEGWTWRREARVNIPDEQTAREWANA